MMTGPQKQQQPRQQPQLAAALDRVRSSPLIHPHECVVDIGKIKRFLLASCTRMALGKGCLTGNTA